MTFVHLFLLVETLSYSDLRMYVTFILFSPNVGIDFLKIEDANIPLCSFFFFFESEKVKDGDGRAGN